MRGKTGKKLVEESKGHMGQVGQNAYYAERCSLFLQLQALIID